MPATKHRTRLLRNIELLETRLTPAVLNSFLTVEHTDLEIVYEASKNKWALVIHDEDADVEYDPADVLLYVGTHSPDTRPTDPAYAFLGVPAGSPYYRLPQSQNPELLLLGAATNVVASEWDRYNPGVESKGRVSDNGRWLKLRLVDVVHTLPNGQPGSGSFSIWRTDTGIPTAFVSSYNDGVANPNAQGLDTTDGISSDDALWQIAGGHQDLSFGFSEKGRYEVTFRASGYFGDGGVANASTIEGQFRESDPITVYFSVGNVGQVQFDVGSIDVNESAGSVAIVVNRINGSDGEITVQYATGDGTATAGGDYTATTGTLTFHDGETTKTIIVPIANDSIAEGPETFQLTLSVPGPNSIADYVSLVEGGNIVGSPGTIVITIHNPMGAAIAGLSPTYGTVTGGTSVVITGSGFASATSVKFGTTAASFVVDSDAQITATTPAGSGVVDVTVTTASGTSANTAADDYTYVTKLTNVVIGDGTGQRSTIRSITLTFNAPIDVGGVGTGSISITNQSDVVIPGLIINVAGAGTNTLVLTFSDTNPNDSVNNFNYPSYNTPASTGPVTFGSLVDGLYRLKLNGASLFSGGVAVDIDANGTAGGTRNDDFHRLFGDKDGDQTVGTFDYFPSLINAINKELGEPGYDAAWDYDNDNVIGTFDFFPHLVNRFNAEI